MPDPRTVRTCRRLDSSGTDTNFWTVCVTCTGECRDLSYDSNCIDSLVGFKVEDHIIEKIRFESKAISLSSCMSVTTFEAPHRILAVVDGLDGILGYTRFGRTCENFHGPTTNSIKLASAQTNSEQCISSIVQIDLYDTSGKCQRYMNSCTPYLNEGGIPITIPRKVAIHYNTLA